MMLRLIITIIFVITLSSCSKKEKLTYNPNSNTDPYLLYKEGLESFNENDYFYASKKFSEAELSFKVVELAARSSIMASYALYGINFYDEADLYLKRFIIS